ncbi:putative non-specific serine/threonine protein kinase [Helianthus debilis subsp. tardiflorus]
MRNQWGLGLHFGFVTIFLVATTYICLGAPNTTVACFANERLALFKFKHSVRDASNMLSSWVGNDYCSWDRVMCNDVTGYVESLLLRGSDFHFYSHEFLQGKELSTSIGELRHLKYLDMSGSDYQGSQIPKFIGSLKQLTYLNLSYAYFSGIIPHHIGNLSNLQHLDLSSHYYINLVVDDMTWISGLSSLEHLDLSNVFLNGAKNIDMVFYMIPSLKELSMPRFGLSNADLGPLRNSSTSLSNINHLDLSEKSFKGHLPNVFLNMTSLLFLDLSSSFAFTPTWNFLNFLSLIPSLLELRLSNCNLKETYLYHTLLNFTTLSNIQHLDLSYNELMGPIPTFHRNLTKLYLSCNFLNGSLPESLEELRLLKVLDVSDNQLTGPIPTFHGKLTELYLSNNKLNGSIPESIGRLAALTDLFLSNNQLSGTIPVSIGQLSKLRSLDVSNNSLEGVVSESHFANLWMLEDLNASYNSKLTFNVSDEWLPPFQLITVNLRSCKIANGFPQWLRNQRKLNRLELSNATISGVLPRWLRKMPIIPFINLSHNNLSGTLTNLPSGDTNIDEDSYYILQELYLQNNIFNARNIYFLINKMLVSNSHFVNVIFILFLRKALTCFFKVSIGNL